ncbi:MAG: DUF3109 family protein [Bacteroidia bacterium]
MKKANKHRATMLEVEGHLVSTEVVEEMFACDLARCKGACCVEGDLGAPLEAAELPVLEAIYPQVKPFLRREGIRAIEQQGTSVRDFTGGHSTPLVEGRECAYVLFDERGTAMCGIEKAHEAGAVDFRKPISCHLYPIRTLPLRGGNEALNYERWDICAAACVRGASSGIRVYAFLKEALIRRYGAAFYEQLDTLAQAYLRETGEQEA